MGPERELIRRVLPYAFPVALLAYVLGTLIQDGNAGISAALAVAVVSANFVGHALSLAWAAGIAPTIVYAVGLGGFVVRLGIIVAIMVALRQTAWFSTGAFIAALVPSTIALLVAEMKLLSGRLQADLWTFPAGRSGRETS